MPDRKTIKKVKQYVYMGVVTKEEFVRLNKEELEKVKNSGSGNDLTDDYINDQEQFKVCGTCLKEYIDQEAAEKK
jgi:hypothetical protein